MRDKLKMNMMGVLGEKIFRDFAESKGAKVKTKTSMYDSEKDFTVDGYTTEVKTQEPYHLKNSFTVKNDQLEKCNKVDLLIFIECPSQRSNNKIVIWCYPQNKRNWQSTITKDGREMYYLNKDDGIKLSYIDDVHIVNEMISFSNSTWQERA
tara:strand:- start:48 stop:503 length:456 start_codon:yes stop_codon:yes gene_type:complete